MTTLSIRLPDDMAERLKNIAKVRDISLNKLMFELSTQALAEEEAKQRFLAAQLRGNPKRALQLLDELDDLGALNEVIRLIGFFSKFTVKTCASR